jgi:uncharacterized NAD(P)/FAD-binding protein YdhS
MKKQYDFSKAKRGAVIPAAPGKTRITIRIDDDVLEWFRKQAHDAGGGSYQAMMNRVLRDYVEGQIEPLEETLRRVLLEVIPSGQEKTRAKKTRKRGSGKKIASK